jgi:hypothetical protein
MSILSVFDHREHKNIFDKEKVFCSNCHFLEIPLEVKKAREREALSGFLYPGMNECHYCHYNEKFANVASQQCTICHKDVTDIIPDDHKVNWLSRHATISRLEENECKKCHRDDYCNDCHLRRDTIRQRVHDRNYMYRHSIEARMNPRRCVSCHTVIYCKDCHYARGVEE